MAVVFINREGSCMETDQIIMYGANWCPDCRRSKQFFGEHRIQYVWVDVQQDAEAAKEVERINNGSRTIPTIVFPDGDVLVEPSNAELARKLNLQTRASRSFYDVVVIGAGPAGLTAATYTTR
jgi:thioredoxin reductase (NADPH)